MEAKDLWEALQGRSTQCEVCSGTETVNAFEVISTNRPVSMETCIVLCETCKSHIEAPNEQSQYHWSCLYESIWSPVGAVQVLAWRILKTHEAESWAQDLLGQLYLDDDLQVWAENDGVAPKTLDSNGVELNSGDSVYLIKDLDVKGASFVAKRGTTVRNIRVGDDPEYVEGKVNGTSLMIKTIFIKKV
jgi:protein PhnA